MIEDNGCTSPICIGNCTGWACMNAFNSLRMQPMSLKPGQQSPLRWQETLHEQRYGVLINSTSHDPRPDVSLQHWWMPTSAHVLASVKDAKIQDTVDQGFHWQTKPTVTQLLLGQATSIQQSSYTWQSSPHEQKPSAAWQFPPLGQQLVEYPILAQVPNRDTGSWFINYWLHATLLA